MKTPPSARSPARTRSTSSAAPSAKTWFVVRSGSGEPAAPRRQSLLRSQARCALLPAATPRLTFAPWRGPPLFGCGVREMEAASTGAAVHGQNTPGDEVRVWRTQVCHRIGNIARVAEVAKWHVLNDLLAVRNGYARPQANFDEPG